VNDNLAYKVELRSAGVPLVRDFHANFSFEHEAKERIVLLN